jgi:hypothetical protein
MGATRLLLFKPEDQAQNTAGTLLFPAKAVAAQQVPQAAMAVINPTTQEIVLHPQLRPTTPTSLLVSRNTET